MSWKEAVSKIKEKADMRGNSYSLKISYFIEVLSDSEIEEFCAAEEIKAWFKEHGYEDVTDKFELQTVVDEKLSSAEQTELYHLFTS